MYIVGGKSKSKSFLTGDTGVTGCFGRFYAFEQILNFNDFGEFQSVQYEDYYTEPLLFGSTPAYFSDVILSKYDYSRTSLTYHYRRFTILEITSMTQALLGYFVIYRDSLKTMISVSLYPPEYGRPS